MNQPRKRTGDLVKGRWKETLKLLGVPEKTLDGNHHPCPASGEGEDRFRFSNHRGRGNFFCACNDGKSDGFKLLECMFSWDFKTAVAKVEEVLGEAGIDDNKGRDPEMALRDLRAIQASVKELKSDALTRNYLASRGIDMGLVYQRGVLFDAKTNYGLRAVGIRQPQDAVAAKFVTADGQPCTFHLTYLERGRKAEHGRARVVATPTSSMGGGAVRLMAMGADGRLGVAEGLETAYSAAQLHGVPTWATLNAAMLEQFVPPPGCTELLIFGDNDENYTGHAAAYALAKKTVLKYRIPARVLIPDAAGQDWNDVLRGAK